MFRLFVSVNSNRELWIFVFRLQKRFWHSLSWLDGAILVCHFLNRFGCFFLVRSDISSNSNPSLVLGWLSNEQHQKKIDTRRTENALAQEIGVRVFEKSLNVRNEAVYALDLIRASIRYYNQLSNMVNVYSIESNRNNACFAVLNGHTRIWTAELTWWRRILSDKSF